MGRSRVVGVAGLVGVAALLLGACGNDLEPTAEGEPAATSSKSAEAPVQDESVETTVAAAQSRSPEDQAVVDATVAAMGAEDDMFQVGEVECWVGDLVDGIGVDTLTGIGFDPEGMGGGSGADFSKLNQADRDLVGASFAKCVDLQAALTKMMVGDSGSEELSQEVTGCMADLDWDKIEVAFGELVVSGNLELLLEAENDPVLGPLNDCMVMAAPGGLPG